MNMTSASSSSFSANSASDRFALTTAHAVIDGGLAYGGVAARTNINAFDSPNSTTAGGRFWLPECDPGRLDGAKAKKINDEATDGCGGAGGQARY
jgi:hypothetical protein